MDDESSSDDHSDQLLPKPAFVIEENENLSQDEKDAMEYILSVRHQKQNLLKRKTIVRKSQEVAESTETKVDEA